MTFAGVGGLMFVGSVEIDVRDLQPDAVTVDALARLQLAAKRSDCRMTLRGATAELCELVDFMGLGDVLVVEVER